MKPLKSLKPIKFDAGRRVMQNIMGDQWARNAYLKASDFKEKEKIPGDIRRRHIGSPPKPKSSETAYWERSEASFGYPSHVKTQRCVDCGHLLPLNRMSPKQTFNEPVFGEKDKPVCEECQVKTEGWKYTHGIPFAPLIGGYIGGKHLSKSEEKELLGKKE